MVYINQKKYHAAFVFLFHLRDVGETVTIYIYIYFFLQITWLKKLLKALHVYFGCTQAFRIPLKKP